MNKEEKLLIMKAFKDQVINYLQGEADITLKALNAYDQLNPLIDQDPDIKKMREIEAIKLRARVQDLNHHISVIKLMIPTEG